MTDLTDAQLDRYARHIILPHIGGAGQAKLLDAHVAVVGAGGIGCPALQYLAAAGVGRITIIDDDNVSLSNLQRQVLFSESDIGTPKVKAAKTALAKINPDVEVAALGERLSADNGANMLAGVDIVLDGTDNFAARLAVNDLCHKLKTPLVSAAIGQFQGQIGTFYGWRDDAPCYRCFVGDAFDAEDCDTCAENGVLGAIVGMMGSFAAMEAIRVLTGFGEEQTGRLHVFDGLKPAMRTMKLHKDAACSTCGTISG
ncbi:HesA/MoeB/ThiF family protein [Sphingorhabdus sp. Alg239-R122]|uniref:HesA/MoeB/ThiF family protein n=1 Tax=Sphingorhabdus sp. Alg239-R122 TaxID=2305989 RepID=UPI0013DB2AA9|nr:HesA/MoeB/ThiF family protein [Sphingorhabdus sp. Alg239-R122]